MSARTRSGAGRNALDADVAEKTRFHPDAEPHENPVIDDAAVSLGPAQGVADDLEEAKT